MPDIAVRATREGREARIWSAGCASGEEPYTLKLLWDLELASSGPSVALSIVATDVDANMLARARDGCFGATSGSSLKGVGKSEFGGGLAIAHKGSRLA